MAFKFVCLVMGFCCMAYTVICAVDVTQIFREYGRKAGLAAMLNVLLGVLTTCLFFWLFIQTMEVAV